MRGIRTQAVAHALKNTLVWMKSDGKEKAQGERTKTYVTQREIFDFVMYFAKMRGIRTQAIFGALKNTLV